ncbi:hypothetical protein QNO07_09500 [Streptomyces sp. 549]|uniref:hypothetical protein n=1 Tax=Streptomyces sp. 549 TaxID=3049076 RepID=UPI0024C233D7|nr:hypothetical protein [Streptomyces sp. 549]MDK1473654.1 hypothetical protein [Streptomyces sp. 549]
MHDPLTVAFEIRRPWPKRADWRTDRAARTNTRWRLGGPFWVAAGVGLYWPCMITVWHRDPSGYDDTTCRAHHWRLHVHHWRIQVHPLQHLRRRLLTRCTWCRGRSRKGDPVCVSRQWDGPRGRWWQGEPGLYHSDCSSIKSAHEACICEQPVFEHDGWGPCARCRRFRGHRITPAQLARVRELAAIPHGARRVPTALDTTPEAAS